MARSGFTLSKKHIIILLLLTGSVFLFIAMYFFFDTQSFLSNAVLTDAEVISFNERDDDGTTMYQQVYEFEDKDSNSQLGTGPTWSSSKPGRVGQQFEIYYVPENPSINMKNEWSVLYGSTLFFGGFGGAALLIGFLLLRKYRAANT